MPAIIGTAGHIDHGKTALIRALTGQDTDRLPEEKQRGISIDLGFAYFDCDDGRRVGIVDVPGHERLVRNMVAGTHGMDLVLLVVAADDGVMPQTREHLEILRLMGIRRAIAVITKIDVAAAERVATVRSELEVLLEGAGLAASPILEVAAPLGRGIAALRSEIERQLRCTEARSPAGHFRLPIDRVFSMRGHGLVVTGTAVSGVLREGDAIRLLPGGTEARARAIQVHSVPAREVSAGQRVAVNLAGVDRSDVRRGHVLVQRELLRVTDRVDAIVEILASAERAVRSHAVLRLHAGTAETLVKMILLEGRAALEPGGAALCQLVLREPIAVCWNDRFVLRDQAAQRTLGGGRILNPMAQAHRRRESPATALGELARAGDHGAALVPFLHASPQPVVSVDSLCESLNLRRDDLAALLHERSDLVSLPAGGEAEAVLTAAGAERIAQDVLSCVRAHHGDAPLEPGMELELLRSRAAPEIPVRLFRDLLDPLVRRGDLVREQSRVRLRQHSVSLSAEERPLATKLEALLAGGGLKPPDLKQVEEALQLPRTRLVEVLAQLEREGRVARVGTDLYYAREPLEHARTVLERHLRQHGEITAATFRDLIDASRKFSIGLLDYFDRTGFTIRVGDVRKLRRP